VVVVLAVLTGVVHFCCVYQVPWIVLPEACAMQWGSLKMDYLTNMSK